MLFGAYLLAGIEMKLSQRITLFSSIQSGYSLSNPNVIAGLSGGMAAQKRLSPVVIPFSANIGITLN
jgi:hypothetical protein